MKFPLIKFTRKDVDTRRKSLRHKLAAALNAANGSIVENLVVAVEEVRLQEFDFDEHLAPALEFMAVMGISHADVFKGLLEDLRRKIAEVVRSSGRREVEHVLCEMLPHISSAHVRTLVATALQRLFALPPTTEPEQKALDAFATSLRGDATQLDKLPGPLQRRVWERQPTFFLAKAQPLVAEYVHCLRHKAGPLLTELRQTAPEVRRQNDSVLNQLLELIGSQRKLYEMLCRRLLMDFRRGLESGGPSVRLKLHSSSEHKDTLCDHASGEPVSLGPEPFLATLRAQLLLSLVDRKVLRESLRGVWRLTARVGADDQGQEVQYNIKVTQRGRKIFGTSELPGISKVEGSLDGSKLILRQIGEVQTYVCKCDISQDLLQLTSGRWCEEGNSSGQQGTFWGSRLGPVSYADAEGDVWDEMSSFIVALDKVHRCKGVVDGLVSAGIRDAAKGHIYLRVHGDEAFAESPEQGGEPETEGVDAGNDVHFLLADPCVVQSATLGLFNARSSDSACRIDCGETSEEHVWSAEVRSALQVLLLSGRAFNISTGTDAAEAWRQLAAGPPTVGTLIAMGLRTDLLATTLRRHGLAKLNESEAMSGELTESIQHARNNLPASTPVLLCLRLLLNSLAYKYLHSKHRAALEECLQLAAKSAKPAHGEGLDWVQRLLVDILVSTALRIGEWFDAGLRRSVVEFLVPLARQDTWVHCRLAELLRGVYLRPNFVSSREEITTMERLLGDGRGGNLGAFSEGRLEDEHYDWKAKLAEIYGPIVRGKGYLLKIYENSKLGRQFPSCQALTKQPSLDIRAVRSEADVLSSPTITSPTTPAAPPSVASVAATAAVAASASPSRGNSPRASTAAATQACVHRHLRAKKFLSVEDGIMAPRVGEKIKDFCVADTSGVDSNAGGMGERAATAVELLVAGYQGYHRLAHLASRWIVALGGETFTMPESVLLRDLMRRKMVAVFDARRADQVLLGKQPNWLVPFIRVPEWRNVVYELVQHDHLVEMGGSSFLSTVLLQICDDGHNDKELQSNSSSGSNLKVFCRNFQQELGRFFALLHEDPALVEPAISEICRVSSFSEYTYVYAQASLRQLMRCRPRWRDSLRLIGQRLTEAASQKSGSVFRLDMRFTSLVRYPDLFKIIWAMCRFGRDIRVVASDMVRLSELVEEILDPTARSALVEGGNINCIDSAAPQISSPVRDSGLAAASGRGAWVGFPASDEAESGPEDDDCRTEVASDQGSFVGDPEEQDDWGGGAWVGLGDGSLDGSEDGEEGVGDGRSRRIYASVASSSAAPPAESPSSGKRRRGQLVHQPSCTENSERTASIFHMPAVSSAASGARGAAPDGHDDPRAAPGAVGPKAAPDVAGALEALRRPAVLDAIILRFVDPSVSLTAREQAAFAKVLTFASVDGLWPGACEDVENGDISAARRAANVAVAVKDELEKIYQVTHHPQHPIIRRIVAMSRLQQHAMASMAGLRWVEQIVLSSRLQPGELLMRMSLGVLFKLLRQAIDMHPNQGSTVTGILKHMLELLPTAYEEETALIADDSEEGVQGRDKDDGIAGNRTWTVVATRQHDAGTHRLRVSRMISIMLLYLAKPPRRALPVLELAYNSAASALDAAGLQLLVSGLLKIARPPYSASFAWALARFLAAQPAVLSPSSPADLRARALDFCSVVEAISTAAPASETLEAEQRSKETLSFVASLRAALPSHAGGGMQASDASCSASAAVAPTSTLPKPRTASRSRSGGPRRTTTVANDPAAEPARGGSLANQESLWAWWTSTSKPKKVGGTARPRSGGGVAKPPPRSSVSSSASRVPNSGIAAATSTAIGKRGAKTRRQRSPVESSEEDEFNFDAPLEQTPGVSRGAERRSPKKKRGQRATPSAGSIHAYEQDEKAKQETDEETSDDDEENDLSNVAPKKAARASSLTCSVAATTGQTLSQASTPTGIGGERASKRRLVVSALAPVPIEHNPTQITIKALQGRWRHSIAEVGTFTISGLFAEFDGSRGRLGQIAELPDGTLEFEAGGCRWRMEEGSADSVVWVFNGPPGAARLSCTWTRSAPP